MYERFFAQFVLQSCAIKSQLQEHEAALSSACDGLSACIRVFSRAARLCQEHFEDSLQMQRTATTPSSEIQMV